MSSVRKYEIYTNEFKSNPHPTYDKMRAEAPVFQQPGLDGETPIWFVTSYEHVDTVLRDPRFVRDERNAKTAEELAAMPPIPPIFSMINNHMLAKDGEDHRRLRALVSKAFTPRLIKAMHGRIQEIAHKLLDEVVEKGEMDLIEGFAYPLPITVIAELLEIPMTDQKQFREWSQALLSPIMDEESRERMMLLMMEFVNYLNILFDERQANPGDDLITGLIQAEEEGDKLSREELFSMLVLLIVAGHETTVGLIGNGAFALLQDQELLARLKENPADVPAAVEEFLRYDGPVERVFVRWAAEDVVLGGQSIKRGEPVISVIAAANRDPELFERPHELDIDRPQNKHMAFGKGVHFCLGAPLARLEGEVAFQTLLARLPNLRLNVAPEAAEVRWSPGLRNFVSLPVKWDPAQ